MNTRRTKNPDYFAKSIFSHATNIRMRAKKNYTIEIKGESKFIKSGPFADHYQFTATISEGTKYNKIKNMKPSCLFLEIYTHFHRERKHNEQEEIANRLAYLGNKAQRVAEIPGYFVPNSVKGKTLETTLNKENGILTIHPFL